VLGFYNPRTKPETLELKRDRLEHWIKAGAVPSDTVRTLVARMPPAPPAEPVADTAGAAQTAS
jgi:small subunit ribosomal protein S16